MSYLPPGALERTAPHDPDRDVQHSLRQNWWPVAYSSELRAGEPLPVRLFGEALVLFRDASQQPQCVEDLCPHRSVPLSLGTVRDGELECRYHGWRFGADGHCSHPAELACKAKVRRRSYRVFDCGLLLWVYPDASEPPPFVNPLSHFARSAGVTLDFYQPRAMSFDHPWELWAASFVDGAHHEFAHPHTFLPGQHGSLDFFFDPTTSPAAFAVRGHHDRTFGVLAYLTFSPTEEGSHRQFLSIFPVSEALPRPAKIALFRGLGIAKLLYDVVYEDYYIVERQLERLRQGASKWGIGGRYTTPVSRTYSEWYRKREEDEVWFKRYDGSEIVLGKSEALSVPRSANRGSEAELVPFRWRQLFRKSALPRPPTWSSLAPKQRLVKRLALLAPTSVRGSAVRSDRSELALPLAEPPTAVPAAATPAGDEAAETALVTPEVPLAPSTPRLAQQSRDAATTPGASELRTFIVGWIRQRLNRPLAEEDGRSFAALGLDSVTMLELAGDLGRHFGIAVPHFALYDHPTIGGLASFLSRPEGTGEERLPLEMASEAQLDPPAHDAPMALPSWSRREKVG